MVFSASYPNQYISEQSELISFHNYCSKEKIFTLENTTNQFNQINNQNSLKIDEDIMATVSLVSPEHDTIPYLHTPNDDSTDFKYNFCHVTFSTEEDMIGYENKLGLSWAKPCSSWG